MTALAEAAPPAALDVSSMSRMQKLAALLIILGPESAAQILKTLDAPDIERISAEMTRMPMITQEVRAEILQEMSEVALTACTLMRGGVEFTQSALEKAVGSAKASDILDRVSPRKTTAGVVHRIVEMEARHLFNLIKDEHVQTIAFITSHLKPEKASELLFMLKPELRDQVVERLATLGATPVEVVETITQVLLRRLHGKTNHGLSMTGGVKAAADVLNSLRKDLSKTILTALDERNADLGQAIRQKMFTFDDMAMLDVSALQKVMREVDLRELAMSLKKADESLRAKLLSAISKRAAETVTEEMTFMSGVRLKEIESAQLKIIEVVRRLESEGEIELDTARQQMAA
jgi:flagellar motor switch protein FliG